jgi:protein phosphatase 1G
VAPSCPAHGLPPSTSSFADSPVGSKYDALIASVGDSRCLMLGKGRYKPLTFDHKPDVEKERKRIETAGDFVKDKRVRGLLGT